MEKNDTFSLLDTIVNGNLTLHNDALLYQRMTNYIFLWPGFWNKSSLDVILVYFAIITFFFLLFFLPQRHLKRISYTICIAWKHLSKVHCPIFQNLVFCFIWRIITPRLKIQNLSLNDQAVWMYEAILWFAVAYILLCKFNCTITRHVFINIFPTEHISAVKFGTGYKKNMSFLVIPKSPKVWKNSIIIIVYLIIVYHAK